jgi:tetratricopeptide (TPR) repeat protein
MYRLTALVKCAPIFDMWWLTFPFNRYLAHEVIAANRMAPEAWCVVGNCFSLQKEHDASIKFFERAIQVDPQFTYAHTLLGHEHGKWPSSLCPLFSLSLQCMLPISCRGWVLILGFHVPVFG